MSFTEKNLIDLTGLALKHNASDIHIRLDEPPCFRIRGELVSVNAKSFQNQDIHDLCNLILRKELTEEELENLYEIDGAFEVKDVCRIRFNLFRFNHKIGMVFRLVKNIIPTIDSLNLDKSLKNIAMAPRGLILVTGATGSGKSTTLASMIDYINNNKNLHIITIEDPIEYLHSSKKSKITQREIGTDTQDYAIALRSALRQDPDIILIGEMRDQETISTALKASETGHLVLATVHTTDAISTINRLISMFHPSEQPDIRKRLSENLYSVICQRMLKGTEKSKVVIAQEILVTTPGVKECILGEQPLSNLKDVIETNSGTAGNGSKTFDQDLMRLLKERLITKEVALNAATSQTNFTQQLIVD